MKPEIRERVAEFLDGIERDHGVRVVYACESGSRAWGFESRDSDYDVRFIYARPHDWYLSIDVEKRRDVIELPVDEVWDINGWDIRKALQLLRKSNPPLLEWLQSPIVYRETTEASNLLRDAAAKQYSKRSAMHHYLHMARKNLREYLRGETVRTKKYLYVLRPLLACRWMERRDDLVPMEFDRLLVDTELEPKLIDSIEALVKQKRAGAELDQGPRIPAISEFCESELERLESIAGSTPKPEDAENHDLNDTFRRVLSLAWPVERV